MDEDHFFLLLGDSALPIGSFAFSSGLESYVQHGVMASKSRLSATNLAHFLEQSLTSTTYTTLPFIKAAYQNPDQAASLDDEFDAMLTCPVARRASVSQGKALMTIWDKALASACSEMASPCVANIAEYRAAIRSGTAEGHHGVAWGMVTRGANISIHRCLHLFLVSQAKAVLSAAVRLGVIGPYQAQLILASQETRKVIARLVGEGEGLEVEDAGQTWPLLDVWQGRHEVLYSRVFNS